MGFELHDNRGLICGFSLQTGGPAVEVEISQVDPREGPVRPLWLNFNLNDTRACRWIGDCSWLDAESREFLLAHDHGVSLETRDHAVLGALADQFADDPERHGILRFYIAGDCLITGRRHPLTVVHLLHEDLTGGMPFATTTALFLRLASHLVASRSKKVAAYADLIDEAEDRVFAGDYLQANLGQHRREMARLRRQLVGGRHVLTDLSTRLPEWWEKPAVQDLRQVADTLMSVGQDLELVEERARLLNEEIDSRLAERTNRNLYFVSMAAAVFLPVTLISGIFGMNVGGLPWVEDENGFLWVMGCMLVAVVVALALVRRRGML